jgi:hypothetical protein
MSLYKNIYCLAAKVVVVKAYMQGIQVEPPSGTPLCTFVDTSVLVSNYTKSTLEYIKSLIGTINTSIT